MKAKVLAGLGAAILVAAAQERPTPPDGLYLFFAPDSPGLDRIGRDLAGRAVRPVYLGSPTDDVPESFLAFSKALGRDYPVVDEDGLALARRLGVSRLPCFVRIHRGRVHKAAGSQLNVKEVLECSR
jgi:hypothetical protein